MHGHSRERSIALLLVTVGLVAASGASCPRSVYQATGHPVLSAEPTLEEVIQVVNQNNLQIERFSAPSAEISASDMPASLRASVAYERDRRLRVRAGTLVTGPELDLGSNDELFWIWFRRNPQQALYYCRHDRYATSPIRQMLPIDPDWLIEAMGINPLDPEVPYEGPFRLKNGAWEIRTVRQTADGPATKITVVDEVRGLIRGQYLFDGQGRLAASAAISEHRYDPVSGLSMARKVEIRCPAAKFTMQVDLGNVRINRLAGDPRELWSMPRYDDYPLVDLGNPNLQLPPPAAQAPALQAPPPATRQPALVRPPSMPVQGRRPQPGRDRPAY